MDLKISDFCWKRGLFLAQNPQTGVFFKLGYERGVLFCRGACYHKIYGTWSICHSLASSVACGVGWNQMGHITLAGILETNIGVVFPLTHCNSFKDRAKTYGWVSDLQMSCRDSLTASGCHGLKYRAMFETFCEPTIHNPSASNFVQKATLSTGTVAASPC